MRNHSPLEGGPALAAARRPEESASPEQIERLFRLSSDLLATFDGEGRFVHLNPAWERVLGWSPEELTGRAAVELIHPEDRGPTRGLGQRSGGPDAEIVGFENRYRCKDGSYRWLEWNAHKQDDTWYSVARDITDHKLLEEHTRTDPLTELPDRAVFFDRLSQALARLERNAGLVAVLFIDLDRFKVVNDAKGHEVGDRLLRAAANRLRQTLRGADTVARFGGDEFVALVAESLDAWKVGEIARRVVGAFLRPLIVEGDEYVITASVGISAACSPNVAPQTLLREADVAMYRAKDGGGSRFELFDDAMRVGVEQRLRVQGELGHALERGQLRVYYQPIVVLPETSVTRCEALVRWQHPTRGLLLPAAFVPLAEQTGLLLPIGAWVLREACQQAQEWRRAGRDMGITVNVSSRQLAQPDLVDLVRTVLDETRLPPPLLCLEITETSIMDFPDRVAPSLAALRRLGVRIAMDDFGTGYSSLTHLRALPLDIIKIDRSFVAGIPTSSEDRAIVAALLGFARDTERSVIAEGVETHALHAELVGLECDLAQGFLYERPKPADQLSLDGYSSRLRPGAGDPSVIREFMRQIGIPARVQA